MKRNLMVLLSVLLLLSVLSSCRQAKNSGEYDFTQLDTLIERWVDKGYYPGAAVAVARGGEVIFEKCYNGYSPDTKVYVASAGKWVAAATIAAVVDRTSLTWNDLVEKWLPEFKGDIKGQIPLRNLLSHTSGVRPYLPEPRVDNYNCLDSAVAEILPLDTMFAYGARFEYGGLAMQIAGRMAEVAAGMTFEQIFQEYIARPLGMKNSHFVPVNTDGGHAPMLGGGLCTTLHDYMCFLDMIYHKGEYKGTQILSIGSVCEMQRDQVRNAEVLPGEYVERALGATHTGIYGLGEWRELIDEKTGMAYQISSPGWAGAYPWINKRDSVYGFFIAHVQGSSAKPDGFSSFYGSPVISRTVSEIVARKAGKVTSGRIAVPHGSLYYEEAGEGIPVIFVHGHSLDHRMWDEQFFELAKDYRVIRYDLRGYGISSEQTEDFQFTHVEDLVALMDALHIEKAHIVGLSLGGFIGADMLGWYPERMLSAFLACGNIRKSKGPSEPMDSVEAARRDREIAALQQKGVDTMKKEWFEGLIASGGSRKERMRVPLWTMIAEWDAWQPLHKEVRVVAGLDAYAALKEKCPAVPTLIVEGNAPGNRYSKNPEILRYLPNGRLHVIDDCGHMMNMEQPEAFNETLYNFLKTIE
ncbi:MAG: class A beta-lactamase-related serine hydrolase [Coprobacter sp.]|nr:class A beta-lactamase-related serine hydrolase [Coprobacter sp.]